MIENLKDELFDWIRKSRNTNEYCQRSLLTDAILEVHKESPDLQKVKSRLLDLTPSKGARLISPPDFIEEFNIKFG